MLVPPVPARGADPDNARSYFGARYYRADLGRFTTPNAPGADQNPQDPQSWNLYAYARNNPLRYLDPTGRRIRGSGSRAQMDWLLSQAQDYVGSAAGQYLEIIWNADAKSWEMAVTGIGMDAFKHLNGAAWDLGQMITQDAIVIVEVTTDERLPKNDAACTFDTAELGGNPTPDVVLNQDRETWLRGFPNTIGEAVRYPATPH